MKWLVLLLILTAAVAVAQPKLYFVLIKTYGHHYAEETACTLDAKQAERMDNTNATFKCERVK